MKMRKCESDSPKVIAVYEAVNRFVCNGRDTNQIIVSEIAKEAGIGKGTIYEYFDTKEEIITRALFYQLDKIIREIVAALSSALTVRDCFTILVDMMESGKSLDLFFDLGKKLFFDASIRAESMKSTQLVCEACQRYMDTVVDLFYNKMLAEKIIDETADKEYIHFLVLASLQMVTFQGYSTSKRIQMIDYSMHTLEKAFK